MIGNSGGGDPSRAYTASRKRGRLGASGLAALGLPARGEREKERRWRRKRRKWEESGSPGGAWPSSRGSPRSSARGSARAVLAACQCRAASHPEAEQRAHSGEGRPAAAHHVRAAPALPAAAGRRVGKWVSRGAAARARRERGTAAGRRPPRMAKGRRRRCGRCAA